MSVLGIKVNLPEKLMTGLPARPFFVVITITPLAALAP